jgi:acetyl-CoA carboxylase carboxyl transferase subunit beta
MIVGRAAIGGRPVQAGFFVFRFMGGSMGSVVGEKITRMFERAADEKTPAVVLSSSSGGARMQEGALSLMQMAKTVAALGRVRRPRACPS